MKKCRRLMSALMALVMALSLFPATARAEASSPTLYVAGVDLSAGGTVDSKTTGVTNGTAVYDAAKKTLTLTDFVYAGEGYIEESGDEKYTDHNGYAICSYRPLKLVLNGASSVTQSGGDDLWRSCGITCYDNLTISGTGSLSATGGAACESIGIQAYGIFSVDSGTVTATGGTATARSGSVADSYGISIEAGSLTLSGGSLTARGGEADGGSNGYSVGVCADVCLAGGSLTASAQSCAHSWAVGYRTVTVAKGCVYTDGKNTLDATDKDLAVLDATDPLNKELPASVAFTYQRGSVVIPDYSITRTAAAKKDGTLLALWDDSGDKPAPVTLQNDAATLNYGKSYVLAVKKGTMVSFAGQGGSFGENNLISASTASRYSEEMVDYYKKFLPDGYTLETADLYVFCQNNLAWSGTVTVDTVYMCDFSLTEDAVEDGAFISLWEADYGQYAMPVKEVSLDDDHSAELVSGQDYLLFVKKGAQVTFSQSFGNYVLMLNSNELSEGAMPEGYTFATADVWLFRYDATYAPQASATVTVGGVSEVEPGSCALSLTAEAVRSGAFISLWEAEDMQYVAPVKEVSLDGNHSAELAGGQDYLLFVKKGAQVTFSQSFGNYVARLNSNELSEGAMPEGYTDETADVWLFRYDATYAPQASATVTVGGVSEVEPGSCTLSLTEDAVEDGAFISLWEASYGQYAAPVKEVSLDGNHSAKLIPGQDYLLFVKKGAQVTFSQSFGNYVVRLNSNDLSEGAMPEGYTDETADVWVFWYDATYAPQAFAYVTVDGVVEPDPAILSLTEDAVEDGAFLSLWEAEAMQYVAPVKEVSLGNDHSAKLIPGQDYLLFVKKGAQVVFSQSFGKRVNKLSSANLPAGAMPTGYTDETADVWLFQYAPSSPQATATVTVDVSPFYYLAVTAQGTGDFVSLASLDTSGQEPAAHPMELDENRRAVLFPDVSYVLTVKKDTTVFELDYYLGTNAAVKDGNKTSIALDYCKIERVIGDENTVYTFSFSASYVAETKAETGTAYTVHVGKFTVSFLGKDGNTLAVVYVVKSYSISSACKDGIIEGVDSDSYWQDGATGKLLGKYSAFSSRTDLVTGDMILVPQDAVAQVTFGGKTQQFYSLADAMRAVENVYGGNSGGPNVRAVLQEAADDGLIPAIVMLADYNMPQEQCFIGYETGGKTPKLSAVNPGIVVERLPFTVPMKIELNGHDVTVDSIMATDLSVSDESAGRTGSLTARLVISSESKMLFYADMTLRGNAGVSAASTGNGVWPVELSIPGDGSEIVLPDAGITCFDEATARAVTAAISGYLKPGATAYTETVSDDDPWQSRTVFMILFKENNRPVTKNVVLSSWVDVSFDANGGKGEMDALRIRSNTVTALTANAFTREGYAFTGWNTKADGSGTAYADEANVTLDADLTLYAQWKLAPALADGKVTAPKGAMLILTTYDSDGRMTLVQTKTVTEACVRAALTEFFGEIPESCKLMLVSADKYVPLCEAWKK